MKPYKFVRIEDMTRSQCRAMGQKYPNVILFDIDDGEIVMVCPLSSVGARSPVLGDCKTWIGFVRGVLVNFLAFEGELEGL